MLSPEFNSAIQNGNLLRVRIMLKDSLIVDPTFVQFNEMFAYARQTLPTILVPFDNGDLEDDCSKWDKDLMNMELVEIVNNFSEARIDHLKKVISNVLADKIRKHQQCVQQQPRQTLGRPTYGTQMNNHPRSDFTVEIGPALINSIMEMKNVMDDVEKRENWRLSDIQKLEKAACQLEKEARQISVAAGNYKNKR